MKRWRVKEVWKCTGWAFVDAPTREEAETLLEDGEGDFHESHGEWEYDRTIGDVEEVL